MEMLSKQVKEPREIENLKYIMSLDSRLIPQIREIASNYYVIEKCEACCSNDFIPPSFNSVYSNVLARLHKFKKNSFTLGIYKYFTPANLNSTVNDQKYIPHIMSTLEQIVQIISRQIPNLLEQSRFVLLTEFLRHSSKFHINWQPVDGYSLLHGDLHVRNILKKNNNFFLIDFEHLRYGPPELDIANLIISVLILEYEQKCSETQLNTDIYSFFEVCENLPRTDYTLFIFLFVLSLHLFYLRGYVAKDESGLDTICKIIDSYFVSKLFKKYINDKL